jgi:hypothetical protein
VPYIEDVLRGKILAVHDVERRSKRQKDLANIASLLESYPDMRTLVPEDMRASRLRL